MKKILLFGSVLSVSLFGAGVSPSINLNVKTPFGYASISGNTGGNSYWVNDNKSPFDAFDFGLRNLLKKDISTKIVNKNFWLILAKNPTSGVVIPSSQGFDINVSVYDMNTNNVISNTLSFGATTSSVNFPNLFKGEFKVKSASQNARVGFLMCADYGNMKFTNSSNEKTTASFGNKYFTESANENTAITSNKIYILYPFSDCSGEVHNCDYEGKGLRICYSSDNFAVRPDKFQIEPVTNKKIAGKEFNLTIKALDYEGNPTKNYNETLYLNENSPSNSPYLDYNDTNASKGCITGIINGKNLQFKNGEANVTLDYSEVGDLNLTVKEINGSEFAKVDENDTSWQNRRITPATEIIKFIPDHFNISANYYNFNNSNFTYISNDLNMSSILDLNITAENKQNETTKNYNSKCYAQNFDLNISYDKVPSKLTKILIKENNNEKNITIPNPISLNLNKSYFSTDHNGSAYLNLKINFKRNPSIPINEFNFTIKDINITDSNKVKGSKVLDKNATFRYGRIDVSNLGSYSKELNTTYKYEYWTNYGWQLNKKHNSSIFGDVNETNSYHPFIIMNVNHNIKKAEENVTLSTTHALPYSTKIHLSIPSWLWYNPLAESYKAPSATNQNCLTHPCEIVTFNKISIGWGGFGKNNGKFSETNRTVEINASLKKVKANKEQVKRLNW